MVIYPIVILKVDQRRHDIFCNIRIDDHKKELLKSIFYEKDIPHESNETLHISDIFVVTLYYI